MKNWKPWAFVVGLFGMWELLVWAFSIPPYILPAPSAIVARLVNGWDYYGSHIPITLLETWLGFGIAVILGVGLAIPVALTKFGEQAIMPVLVATQTIPKVALAPIFVIWFGFGIAPKVTIAALIAFFPIVVNMARGLRSVDPEIVQYMTTLGASRWTIFVKFRLPSSLPYLLSAMKMSIALAVIGAIVGEFVGADSGLGYAILRAINNFDTVSMFAGIFVVSFIGMLSYGVIALIERRTLAWEPDSLTSTT